MGYIKLFQILRNGTNITIKVHVKYIIVRYTFIFKLSQFIVQNSVEILCIIYVCIWYNVVK
jgi:hypothetical protein